MVRANVESIWERVFRPAEDDMPVETARYMLKLHFSESDRNRVDELSERARQGRLSPDEASELDQFLSADAVLGILKSKARHALRGAQAES